MCTPFTHTPLPMSLNTLILIKGRHLVHVHIDHCYIIIIAVKLDALFSIYLGVWERLLIKVLVNRSLKCIVFSKLLVRCIIIIVIMSLITAM